MNTRRIIENGFYGLFTAIALVDKYAPYATLIAVVAIGVYWWPESKIFLIIAGGMVAFVIGMMVLFVILGTVARRIGYEPDIGLIDGIDTRKD